MSKISHKINDAEKNRSWGIGEESYIERDEENKELSVGARGMMRDDGGVRTRLYVCLVSVCMFQI